MKTITHVLRLNYSAFMQKVEMVTAAAGPAMDMTS